MRPYKRAAHPTAVTSSTEPWNRKMSTAFRLSNTKQQWLALMMAGYKEMLKTGCHLVSFYIDDIKFINTQATTTITTNLTAFYPGQCA